MEQVMTSTKVATSKLLQSSALDVENREHTKLNLTKL
jgi:hypothetical protein